MLLMRMPQKSKAVTTFTYEMRLQWFDIIHTACSEDLNPVVAKVDDDDVAVGGDADAGGAVELAGPGSGRAEGVDEDSVGSEDLDAVVARVCHDDVTLFVHSNSVGASEGAGVRALQTKIRDYQ